MPDFSKQLENIYPNLIEAKTTHILAVVLTIDAGMINYKAINCELKDWEKSLNISEVGEVNIANIDREFLEFMQVRQLMNEVSDRSAFLIELYLGGGLYRNIWLFDPDKEKFVYIANQIIDQHYN